MRLNTKAACNITDNQFSILGKYFSLSRKLRNYCRFHVQGKDDGVRLHKYWYCYIITLSYIIVRYVIVTYVIVRYVIVRYLIVSYGIVSYVIVSYVIVRYVIVLYIIVSYVIVRYVIVRYATSLASLLLCHVPQLEQLTSS